MALCAAVRGLALAVSLSVKAVRCSAPASSPAGMDVETWEIPTTRGCIVRQSAGLPEGRAESRDCCCVFQNFWVVIRN
ncbi:hypothetical protein FB45DRAFT_885896 [Roridomyces roridus]|uniref:Secreted protein n=1 Tax=Roridomyces roridus TaxID=1738132 RepID=A0AAD7CI28_9AGAR|nr:hypothetical protein FB45DRAFT_885896 [Roridomyces roridus]